MGAARSLDKVLPRQPQAERSLLMSKRRKTGHPSSTMPGSILLLILLLPLALSMHYDRDAITFSPDGSLLQLDYAARAVSRGSLCIGLRCKDGVVLAVDRLIPKADAALLLAPRHRGGDGAGGSRHRRHSISRIQRVDDRIALLVAGMPADGAAITGHARREARRFRDRYGDEPPGRSVAAALASYLHECSTRPDRRVLASAALIASMVDGRAELFSVDTSACLSQCKEAAYGTQSAEVKETLSKMKLWDLSCSEAMVRLTSIIQSLWDGEGDDKASSSSSIMSSEVTHSIEMAYMNDGSNGALQRDPPLTSSPSSSSSSPTSI